MEYTASATQWSFLTKLAFRFFSVFLILLILLNPNGGIPIPLFMQAYNIYRVPFEALANLLGKQFFALSGDLKPFATGSGDTTLNYLLLLASFTVSIIGTAVWSVLDSKRPNYDKLLYWVSVCIRYYLATIMVEYGFMKVFKLQFPFPGAYRLQETYGASSPMGLAWTFFGFSEGYNYFMGFAELSGGLLLYFRRTATLGALISLSVAINIMVVNYCFDIPVKILSTTLVVLCLFLLAKDAVRLLNFFVLNKAVLPADIQAPRFKRWQNITLIVVKYLLITEILVGNIYNGYYMKSQMAPYRAQQNVFGNYDFIAPANKFNWTGISIKKDSLIINRTALQPLKFFCNIDMQTHQLMVFVNSEQSPHYKFGFKQTDTEKLMLNGNYQGVNFKLNLIKQPDNQNNQLMNRGFHWISEYPYNR